MTDRPLVITPVYFPFTYISSRLLRELAPCWKEVAVYQPSEIMIPSSFRPWIDQGLLKLRIPLKDAADTEKLRHELRSCQAWGEMHGGIDVEYLKAAGTAAPYVNEMHSGIVTDIKKYAGTYRSPSGEDAEKNLFSARLFLHLAQDYDQKSDEMKRDIRQFERNQLLLEEALHPSSDQDTLPDGLPGVDLSVMQQGEKPDVFMMQRIRAWNHLYARDSSDTDFLFTDSRDALLLILGEEYEKFEVSRCRLSRSFPFHSFFAEAATTNWSEAMQEKIDSLTQEPHKNGALLKCYLIPDQSSHVLLERACSAKEELSQKTRQPDGIKKNALFGLLELEAP
ncbi:MAG: hypothetical protein LWX55_10035 [Deltaproteobacteria bacterium]|jgi:hypothetical protein|nr:hypothetical protein [Deltaproteobacteria bacterium]